MGKLSSDDLRKLQSDAVTYNTTEWNARGDAIAGIGTNQKFSDEAWTTPLGKISATPVTTARGIVFVKPADWDDYFLRSLEWFDEWFGKETTP